MHVIKDISEWKALRKTLKGTVGFVPTMGNLHEGHASLLKRAAAENDIVLLSIFVNPTQFNEPADFERYPRTLDQDLKLAEAENVDYVLAFETAALYPDDFNFKVSESEISAYQEGVFRPGHFTGMLTIVLKWLLLAQADRAYFGEKDYQQLQLIQAMAKAFLLDVDIVSCPTIREDSGLPLSSRNRLLNAEERKLADKFAEIFQQIHLPCEKIIQDLQSAGILVDYVEDRNQRRFAAVKTGRIRLIDNRALTGHS